MPTYSNSRLNKFEECPRAYKFKYIDRVEVERVQNVYGFLGSRVHEALEVLYEDLKNGRRNSLENLLEIYENLWEGKWSDDVQVSGDRYSPEHFRKVGRSCIRNYYEEHEPFDRDRTVDTELKIYPEVDADGREYTFVGYIDRLAVTPEGKYEVHDYKTSKNLPSVDRVESKRQLPLYQLGVQQSYPDAEEVELVWHYVRFGKDIRVSHSREEIDEIQGELVDVIREIERAEEEGDFPTGRGKGARCDWCDYKSVCPEWEHLYETREMPENEFLDEEGVKLVDELDVVEGQIERLEEEKSELRERKRKLEEAILEYAEREGVYSVFGSEKVATVRVDERIEFPGSGDEGREELDRLVREAGLWDELETTYLNLSSLRRAYREGDVPGEFLEDLEEFKEVEESREVELEDLEG